MSSPWGGLTQVVKDVRQSLIRFPISILSALAGTTLSIIAFHSKAPPTGVDYDFRNALVAMVGIGVAALATLWGESRKLQRSVNLLITAAVSLCLWLVALYWKRLYINDVEFISRCLQLAVVVHLAIGYLPAAHMSRNGFWQYNRLLFRRIVLVGIYAAIIAIGLCCAVLGTRYLLDIKLKDTIYVDIFMVCFFAYHPCVALGGIPKNLAEFEEHHEYPAEFAVVAKFILLPLVALYGVILYLYLGKILVSWELPRGGVGYLVSTVSLLGIFCFLLLEPAIVAANSKLQGTRSIFFFLLFPLIFLLFLGLKVRIGNYGFTSHRYLLTAYGIWISSIAIYFLCSKVRDIKVIPSSLGVLTLLTLVGPWSAYELPPWLQFRALQKTLSSEGLLRDGRAVKGDKVQSPQIAHEIEEQIKYVLTSSQRQSLLRMFLSDREIENEMGEKTRRDSIDHELGGRLVDKLGLKSENALRHIYFSATYQEQWKPTSVKGYSTYLHMVGMSEKELYYFQSSGSELYLMSYQKRIATFDLRPFFNNVENYEKLKKRIEFSSGGDSRAKLIVRSLSADVNESKTIVISFVNADVLIR